MTTGGSSVFFNNFKSSQEQLLLEDLIIESISIYGIDTYYIPRKLNNYDSVYGADDQSSYEAYYPICAYIESIDKFGGDGNFMSKFGLEIRDQMVFSVAQRIFNNEVGAYTAQARPNEGDLMYFPLNKKIFQIKFVDKFDLFYQLGGLQTYKLTCELFEYSGERFNTGIAEVDAIQNQFNMDILTWALRDESGNVLMDENGNALMVEGTGLEDLVPGADNDQIQRESDQFVDFSAINPFGEQI